MAQTDNPFFMRGYHGAAYFCDRESETEKLLKNIRNGNDTTLFSIRRMGKTGLIRHVFHTLKKAKGYTCIYLDIFPTQSFPEFTGALASAILRGIEALTKKEMIVPLHDENGRYYRVYDCFLLRWLERLPK